MNGQTKPLNDLLDKLPVDLYQEVRDFIEFLIRKKSINSSAKPVFDWAGSVKGLKNTSVEMQHKISEDRLPVR
ncbi:MAG: DUF2281 domain-containing protein [Candidatus Wallbacteria bacterium]|nr:DUF2281 domain-containing protein [Candidatus Wallbacteria bacterium]